MKLLSYQGGQDVRQGDRITYQGEPGEVEFVITEKAGDPALDWYVDQYPGGGMMITARTFGRVFLAAEDIDEDLTLVTRR